jgi:ABC-type Fe3+-hydroxamate transport system substrate-binding protein
MRTRTALTTALLALVALTGCSSDSSDDEPSKPTPAVTVTQTVDTAAARRACVDAWAELLQDDEEVGVEDEPAVCDEVPGQSAEMYMEALHERNQANRDALQREIDEASEAAQP